MGKIGESPAWQLTKVRNKKEVIVEARNKGRKFIMRHWWISVISRIRSWNLSIKSTKARVVLRGDNVKKNDSGSCAVFAEQGSSASQMTAAKNHGHYIKTTGMRRTSSRCSILLYPESKWKMHRRLSENSRVRMSRYLDTSTETHMAKFMVQYGKTQLFFLNEICTVIFWPDNCRKGNLRKF